MQNKPIPDSYCLIPGKLLAGEYPGARHDDEARLKLRKFLDCGVTYFLDLTEAGERNLQPYAHLLLEEAEKIKRAVIHRRFAIRDVSIPSLELMREIQQCISDALAEGHVLYFHCWGGIGRTGTVAGCYLREQGTSGDDALARIALLRRPTPDGYLPSPATREQVAFVQNWKPIVRQKTQPEDLTRD